MAAEFWYECPACEYGFLYAPHNPTDAVHGHYGHKCTNPECGTMMDWDEPNYIGPKPCS